MLGSCDFLDIDESGIDGQTESTESDDQDITAETEHPQISNIEQSRDTVTITFSEEIESADMPNSITFASGSTYFFEIFQDGNKLSYVGLLSSTENSITLAVLVDWSSVNAQNFVVKVFAGSSDSPELIAESDSFDFTEWNGTTVYVDTFYADKQEIWVQMMDSEDLETAGPPISGFGETDFSIFDSSGNKLDFTYSNEQSAEYIFTKTSGELEGDYWVRFSRDGYKPDFEIITIQDGVLAEE